MRFACRVDETISEQLGEVTMLFNGPSNAGIIKATPTI
jgi:hypothetical protein